MAPKVKRVSTAEAVERQDETVARNAAMSHLMTCRNNVKSFVNREQLEGAYLDVE